MTLFVSLAFISSVTIGSRLMPQQQAAEGTHSTSPARQSRDQRSAGCACSGAQTPPVWVITANCGVSWQVFMGGR